jgi:hypothetical protein
MVMAQTTPSQTTRPSTEPSLNRNTNTTPTSVNQSNNSTLNNNGNPNNTTNTTTNPNNPQQPPVNNNMNNTPANSTLNSNTMPENSNPNMKGTLNSTTANASYSVSVPTSVQTSFTTAYPAAGTAVWSQSGDWYRARYMENGKLMEASYREDGKTFTRPASPIMRTYVPEETVSKALEMYGMNVYAIAGSKGTDGQMRYNVTIIENGQSRTEWMNEDGSAVTNPYRTEMDEQPANQNMNNTNGQQPADAGTTDQAEPVINRETPATDPENSTDLIYDEYQPASTLEESNNPQQVDPDNKMNNEGLNNGTSSDNLIRRNDEIK